MFKGEEAKVEVGGERGKKGGVPFQKDQMGRVIEVLGNIDSESRTTSCDDGASTDPCAQRRCGQALLSYQNTASLLNTIGQSLSRFDNRKCLTLFRLPNTLWAWYSSRVPRNAPTNLGFELLKALLTYDPTKRLTARDSLVHAWWSEAPKPHAKYV